MFFVLSKALYFLIQPINWLVGLLLYALFTRKARRRKNALLIATIMTLLVTNRLLFNAMVNWWEVETISFEDIQEPYDIGILVGGYSNPNVKMNDNGHGFWERADRLLQTLELYQSGKIRKILLTGGSKKLRQNSPSEALVTRDFLLGLGVPDSCIIVEPSSRNTHENALFTSRILAEQYPDARCLLITSAWHMPRAMGCFEKEGVRFTPFSVDHIGEPVQCSPATLLPDKLGFYRWEFLIKEWIGYVAYWASGYL